MTTPRVLLDRRDPARQMRTEVLIDPDTGCPVIRQRQRLETILEHNAAKANAFDKHIARKAVAGFRHVATIPHVVMRQLEEAGILDDQQLFLKWLSERDARAFRTDDGSRLA